MISLLLLMLAAPISESCRYDNLELKAEQQPLSHCFRMQYPHGMKLRREVLNKLPEYMINYKLGDLLK